MAQLSFDVKLDRPADEVWEAIGPFGGLGDWFPGVEKCEVEGDVRTVAALGATLKERELERDDTERMYSYSIVDGPFQGLEHHKATLKVEEDGDGSVVVYEIEIEPDEAAPIFEGIYQGAIDAVKAKFEG